MEFALLGRGGYYALFARSNEPCMAGMAGGQRELALIWPEWQAGTAVTVVSNN